MTESTSDFLDLTTRELKQLAKHEPSNDQQSLVCRLAQNHLKLLEAVTLLRDAAQAVVDECPQCMGETWICCDYCYPARTVAHQLTEALNTDA